MTKPLRLDAELIRRGLAGSRTEAQRAIRSGRVLVRGLPVTRPSAQITAEAPVTLDDHKAPFVSRGGEKLDGALGRLAVPVAGRRWLDAGASTGGFTDRLLQGSAAAVVAVDVGYGQLAWKLRNDDRVVVIERKNVRHLDPDDLPWRPEGIVADLSFISLTLVLEPLARVAEPDADFLVLVKPQFEVGRRSVGKGGVVRDPELWRAAILRVVEAGRSLGLDPSGAVPSPLPGPSGNREFFLHLNRRGGASAEVVDLAVSEVAP